MKFTTLLFFSLLGGICHGSDVMQKPAVLFMPEQIEVSTRSGYLLKAEMGFRWDETEPVKINVWNTRKNGEEKQLLGDVEIFDEQGKRLEQSFFMSIPPIPDDVVTIHKGEYKRFGFFVWNGAVTFPRSGNYYVMASFGWAQAGGTNVVFTAPKRWFKVILTPERGSSL